MSCVYLLFNVALAASALPAVVCAADLNFVESAVAAVMIVFAHIHVACNAEIDVFHNTSGIYPARKVGEVVIILRIKSCIIPAPVDKRLFLF